MAKKFKIITTANSNEVSLCSKYNSGANKQTEFELVKNKEGSKDSNMKDVITKFMDLCEETQEYCAFKDFLEYWLEYDINNTYYGLLSEALQAGIRDIQYKDVPKEEKEIMFRNLFDMFINEFNTLPITKTSDGKYEVSLTTKSPIQDEVAHPQNEADTITKEKTSTMENVEDKNIVQKALETISNALGLAKTETPAEETPEETQTVETPVEETVEEAPVVEEPAEETVEEPAEEQAPVEEETPAEPVEKTEEPATEEAPQEDEAPVVEETTEEPAEPVEEETPAEPTELEKALEKAKTLEAELESLKKSNEEKEVAIEKMSFVQKAKDEFSMLVGTPEEIGERLYEIAKSNLGEESKSFILDQLKKVSKENAELTEEVGSITKSAEGLTEEEEIFAKAQKLAEEKGISVNKALRQVK